MDLLHAMRIFVSVAEQGSMAGAARALDLAPAVVTRQLAQLEAHLGARLLQRNSRRLSLTDVGRDYRDRASAILAKVEDATALVTLHSNTPAGRLRLTATSVLLTHAVTPLLPEFRRRYPDIQLGVDVRRTMNAPDENADLTLLSAPLDSLDGPFVARLLAHSEIVLCASPAYLRAQGTPRHPSELAGHEVLVVKSMRLGRTDCWTFEPRAGGAPVAVSGRMSPPQLDTEHRETLHDAVRAGLGIGPMMSLAAVADLQAGRLVRVLPDWRAGRYGIYAATVTRQHQPARVRAAIAFFAEAFGGRPHDPWLERLERQPQGSQVELTRTV